MIIHQSSGILVYSIILFIMLFYSIKRKNKSKDIFLRALTLIVLFSIIEVTIFPMPITKFGVTWNQELYFDEGAQSYLKLIPFLNFDKRNFILNMFMTFPLGFVLWLNKKTLKESLLYTLGYIMLIEGSQLILNYTIALGRYVDVDDLIAALLGTFLSYSVMALIDIKKAKKVLSILTVLTLLGIYSIHAFAATNTYNVNFFSKVISGKGSGKEFFTEEFGDIRLDARFKITSDKVQTMNIYRRPEISLLYTCGPLNTLVCVHTKDVAIVDDLVLKQGDIESNEVNGSVVFKDVDPHQYYFLVTKNKSPIISGVYLKGLGQIYLP